MNPAHSAPRPFSLPGVPQPQLGDRSLFPHLDYRIYLAHAAISPLNLAGERAATACLQSVGARGNGSFPIWMAQRERMRVGISDLLHVTAEQVGLSPGCTRSISDVALALPWKSGAQLVSYQGEFPANVVPYQQAARLHGGELRMLNLPLASDPNAEDQILTQLRAVLSAPSSRVAFLAVSAVQFQTGLRMPLAEMGRLCEEYGVSFLVDGIQACGVIPLDLTALRIDAFFTGAHKWLLGVEGAGFFTLSPSFSGSLRPQTAGWLSTEHAADFLFKGPNLLRYDRPYLPAPAVFEGSTANAVGFAALEAGVDLIAILGPAKIFQYVQSLFDHLEPQLQALGFQSLRAVSADLRSTILSMKPPAGVDLGTVFAKLDARGIRVSIPDGLLRIAPHFSNNSEQMDQLVATLVEILAEK